MTKKKTTLVNESVIRRWGKLANMAPLTESFIDTLDEEEEMEMDAAVELDADGGEEEMMSAEVEMEDGGAEVQMSEEEAEVLVAAIADAVSQVTGVDVDVESDEDMEAAGEEMEAAGEDLEDMADDMAAMGGPLRGAAGMRGGKSMRGQAGNRQDETLDLEVIDDEALTEAVLKRVVERLLSNN